MELLTFFAIGWFWYLACSIPGTGLLVYWGRQRVTWHLWEVGIFVLPMLMWFTGMMIDSSGKTLSNMGEVTVLGLGVNLCAVIRVMTGRLRMQSAIACGLQVVMCVIAVAVYFLTPPLPE